MNKERTGLRIRSDKNVDVVLKKAFVHFAKWLRCHYNFPKRVPVYVKESYYIITHCSKEQVSATFFAPYDKQDEPYIRIATGDFYDLEQEHGRRDAILMTLKSLAHELQHYYQWLDDEEFLEDEAEEGARELIIEYIEDNFEEFWSSLSC
ncbi:hypothetical protein [Paenibacillus thiaminolyticus]|uniref:FOG: TPR repeat n=1 Tax=Paenibacillus thiaminolyticus TaxID=49283 RepID=A0A3A3GFC4_PANTH|nr:hypothetical protein [Paenibacillus thiaminolyticus]RJG22784.1 hypothetical protein DQX05_16255 [Paenibacillus thiaminolyticus]